MTERQLDIQSLLQNPSRDSNRRKMAWRLFRQFQDPATFAREFGIGIENSLAWQFEMRTGRPQDQAIKLGLLNRSHESQQRRCETVVLFPGRTKQQTSAENRSVSGLKTTDVRNTKRRSRATACISSQPGCGVGCPFCATGKLGYQGNLSVAEIVEQVYWSGLLANQAEYRLRNVVFMGMGEPLHNVEAVQQSIEHLTDDRTFGLQAHHITLSTAGVPQAMLRVARAFPELRIALSLHSAIGEKRKFLVPRATADLTLLRKTVIELNHLQPNHPVWLEVVLLQGLNDSSLDLKALLRFCDGLRVEVNLIPYNATTSGRVFYPTTREVREQFAGELRAAGIRTTIRTSFGSRLQAACGQLGADRSHFGY